MSESAEVIKMSVTMTRWIRIEPSVARALHKKRVAGRGPLAALAGAGAGLPAWAPACFCQWTPAVPGFTRRIRGDRAAR